MSRSRLQEPFMYDVAEAFAGAKNRIVRRIAESPQNADQIVDEELRSLYHGLFMLLDGEGSTLADEGLVKIVDQDGEPFDNYLHEICFKYWPTAAR